MVNKQIILGRVGNDPKKIEFKNGDFITVFNIATNSSYKDKEGKYVDKTEWHKVRCYVGRMSEAVLKNVQKGDMVYVEGRTETQTFKTKEGVESQEKIVMLTDFKKMYTTAKGGGHEFKNGEKAYKAPIVPDIPASLQDEDDDSLPF